MTYDISGSGFDDATSEMQLQLGGERGEGERDHTHTRVILSHRGSPVLGSLVEEDSARG